MPASRSPRMLVLTLSSGESALPLLREQLRRQTFQADHVVIEGLGNREAHAALYRMVMERAADYDLFFKIDADMTFRRDTALADLVTGIAAYPEVRHFLFPIWDYFTEQEIRGVSLYRSGVRWPASDDGLFVDPAPEGAKAAWCGGSALPVIDHGKHASDFECFSFGVHKMIKVLQRDRSVKKVSKQSGRLLDLNRIRALCRTSPAPRHWQCMRGIAWALANPGYQQMSRKADLQAEFERCTAQGGMGDASVRRLALDTRFWLSSLAKELGWLGTLRAMTAPPPAQKARTVIIDSRVTA